MRIHYFVDSEKETNPVYEVEEMKDMYEGIHVKGFLPFPGRGAAILCDRDAGWQ